MEAACLFLVIAGIVVILVSHPLWKGRIGLSGKRTSSGKGGMIGLQEIVEPNVQHVVQVKDQHRKGNENGAPPEDEGTETNEARP